ncbi:MAG TPA: AAA family ATPase, partial [Treponema sp.]|nr:AAA family ATPase [Treponema sp.]
MRPRKLRMYNIGPFAGAAEIDFTRLEDIFLISGKTGSGKTTIFDGICFALYGKLPGGRKNLETKLRSDFAELDEECWVELEFSLGQHTYLVQRSPKMERPKKRGEGTTTVEETAVLYRITETGQRESLSSRKSEADEKITRLLGLTADEFAKIVLLPQGEFAQFLQQNSQERREVLKKLFPVDEATAIRELAVEKRKEAEALAREAHITLKEAASRYNETENRSAQEGLRQELKRLSEKDTELLNTIKSLSEAVSLAKKEAELLERLTSLRAEQDALETQRPRIEALTQALARNQRAKPAQELLIQDRELQNQHRDLAQALTEAQQEAEGIINQYAAMESRASEMETLSREAASLREQKGALEQAAEEEQRLIPMEERLTDLKAAITESELSLPALRGEIEELSGRINAAEEAVRKETNLQEQKELSLSVMEALRNLLQLAREWSEEAPEYQAARDRLASEETELARIEQELPELTVQIEDLERALKQGEQEALAARLAATLEQGKPCPVCGSLHHPDPARAPAPEEHLEARIKELKQEQQGKEARRTELRTDIRNLRMNQERLRRELGKLMDQYKAIRSTLVGILHTEGGRTFKISCIGDSIDSIQPSEEGTDRGVTIPPPAAVQEDIKHNSTLAEALSKTLQQTRKESQNLSQLHRLLQEKEQLRSRMETKLEGDRKQAKELGIQIDESRGRLRQFLDRWKTETISLALNRLKSRLETLDSELQAYTQKKQDLAIQKAQILQKRDELENRLQQLEEAIAGKQQAISSLAVQLGFSGTEDLKAALLSPETEISYQNQERLWKENQDRLRHQIEEARRALDSLRSERNPSHTEPGLDRLEAELAATETERQNLAASVKALQLKLQSLEQDQTEYQRALDRYNSLNQNLIRYRALADDLSGANPKRWPFDSWLLSLYLQEVTSYANRRLERMSEGRYSILLNPEGEGGRAMAGLDLAVFDSYTGKTRPCATLSGGESFMASISLALGLADSIQSRAGAVRL